MKDRYVWAVIHESTYFDTNVEVYLDKDKAIKEAFALYQESLEGEPQVSPVGIHDLKDRYAFYAVYSTNGDHIRVERVRFHG